MPPFLKDFGTGLALPFRAVKVIARSAKLTLLSLLAALVTAFALVALWFWTWGWTGRLVDGWFSGDGTLRNVAAGLIHVVLFFISWAAAALTVPHLLLAPLQDPLSEAAEQSLGRPKAPGAGFVRSIGLSIVHTVVRLAMMLAGFVVLLPLHFIPVASSVVYAVLSSVWSMWCVCAEYVSGPAARHLKPFSSVTTSMRTAPFKSLGLGAALYALLFIPPLNFFLVPVAVVAGTLLYVQLETSERTSV